MDLENIELDRVNRLINEIQKIIDRDNKVTDEEELLFKNILENLSHYKIMLMDFTEDNILDVNERRDMQRFRQNIIGDAKLIAFEDENFSEDEIAIIAELRKFQINENY